MVDVSVIIVNYNTFHLTKNSIESVVEKTKEISYEIIVIDNASSNNQGEEISRNFGNKIIFIQSNKNLGFGKANNLGLSRAQGRNIIFLNSDTLLINNAIKILSDFLDKN